MVPIDPQDDRDLALPPGPGEVPSDTQPTHTGEQVDAPMPPNDAEVETFVDEPEINTYPEVTG